MPSIAVTPPPLVRPPCGVTLPMQFVAARDADTIVARVAGSAFEWALRLIDTWGPELDAADQAQRALARRGAAWVVEKCGAARVLWVHVPFVGGVQPLKRLTFDRVPAWVWVDDEKPTLNRMLVEHGFASTKKGGRLGE